MQNDYITLAEAARRLNVTRKVINSLIRRGVLTAHRHPLHAKGARVYVSAAEVDTLSRR